MLVKKAAADKYKRPARTVSKPCAACGQLAGDNPFNICSDCYRRRQAASAEKQPKIGGRAKPAWARRGEIRTWTAGN